VAEAVFVFTGASLRAAAAAPAAGNVALCANDEAGAADDFAEGGSLPRRPPRRENRVAVLPFETTDKRLANPSLVGAGAIVSGDLRGLGGPESEVLRARCWAGRPRLWQSAQRRDRLQQRAARQRGRRSIS
jgi:hypothetical protein